jgi:hypothetical protein
MSRKNDPQQRQVYIWEETHRFSRMSPLGNAGPPKLMTLAECRKLARQIMRRYHVAKPTIYVRQGRGSHSHAGAAGMHLTPWDQRPLIVLHEAAHTIAARRGFADHHGPIFLRIFIELMASYFKVNKGDLIRDARRHGLKVASWASIQGPGPLAL